MYARPVSTKLHSLPQQSPLLFVITPTVAPLVHIRLVVIVIVVVIVTGAFFFQIRRANAKAREEPEHRDAAEYSKGQGLAALKVRAERVQAAGDKGPDGPAEGGERLG